MTPHCIDHVRFFHGCADCHMVAQVCEEKLRQQALEGARRAFVGRDTARVGSYGVQEPYAGQCYPGPTLYNLTGASMPVTLSPQPGDVVAKEPLMTLFEYAVIVKPTDPYAEPRLLNDDTIGVTFAANAEAARTKALLIHASEVDEDDRGRVEVIIRPFVEPQRLY